MITRLNTLIFVLIVTSVLGLAHGEPAARIFDVRRFGAIGNGKTLDTTAIQKALDECGKAGGGIVRLSSGKYLSKPLFLSDRTTLQIDAGAILQATDNPSDFAVPGKTNAFISFINGNRLREISIIGPGTIDGAGGRWWGPAEAARRKTPGYVLPRPRMITLSNCTGVSLQNITLQNSALTHFAPTDCEDVVVSNVIVQTPGSAANTDGIDPINCKHVRISHCKIQAGDDNICIKSTQPIPGRVSSEDIIVEDCVILRGHGISIGAATVGGVRDVTVRRCSFNDTDNGIRIKSQRTRGGVVENIRFSDITMSNVDPAITFTCYYMTNSSSDPVQRFAPEHDAAQAVTSTTPIFRNIVVSNLTATCPRAAGMIIGLPESRIADVVLDHVDITASGSGLSIRNATGIRLNHVKIHNRVGPPVIVEDASVGGM